LNGVQQGGNAPSLQGETGMAAAAVNRVVLAFSGGLDTSVILKWLQQQYRCEVVTFTADLGQGEEIEPARHTAQLLGVKPEHIFIEDLREEFVRDFVFPMMRANTLYEGLYLLGTSIARPLIAKRQIEIARAVSADAVSHGATGKGNDQVRFELGYYALAPDIKIIAPWREWDLTSRDALIAFAEAHQIPIPHDKRGEAPFSTDANLLHTSSEGKALEDPWNETPAHVYSRTDDPVTAPDTPEEVVVAFKRGDAVAVNAEPLSPAALLTRLNELGKRHGIGRLDLVENRFVGMKSRGMYETPGGTILGLAHRGIEQLTLDRGAAHLKDELMPRYAELIYNGLWFSPERLMLQAAIDTSQERVEGEVRLKLYKGSAFVTGRRSPQSLYNAMISTFDDDGGAYDQKDAEGFIKLNALRLQLLARRAAR
jgi:argininosuccinate synthase